MLIYIHTIFFIINIKVVIVYQLQLIEACAKCLRFSPHFMNYKKKRNRQCRKSRIEYIVFASAKKFDGILEYGPKIQCLTLTTSEVETGFDGKRNTEGNEGRKKVVCGLNGLF